MPKSKIILAGVDGGTWNVVDPLLKNDMLPNFAYLVEHGVSGPFESFDPLYANNLD